MLTVWGRPSAYNVQKVRWFIDELGLESEHINIGGAVGGLDSDAFLAINPNARIPVIKDEDLYVWESNTIIRYLAATYGKHSYWLADPAERSLVERWMDWELASHQPDFLSLFWGYYRTPENQRASDKIGYAMQRCNRNLSILNEHLANNPYVAGAAFTIADIAVGTSFYRYFNMGVNTPALTNIDKWYQRLAERPAYQNNIMVPFNELKGRLEY